jgi:hypothetical protein
MPARCVGPTPGVARPSATGYGGPVRGARTPSTFDDVVTGLPAHFCFERSAVRFGARRDAATGGLSGRRPRTCERTSELAKGRRGRSRSRVTNRATMIYRPRAGNASRRDLSLAHRHPSIASRRTRGAIALFGAELAGGPRAQVSRPGAGRLAGAPNRRGGRCSERGSRENGGRPPPFPERLRDLVDVPPRDGAERFMGPGGVARQ